MKQSILTRQEIYESRLTNRSFTSNPLFKDLQDAGLTYHDFDGMNIEFSLGKWFNSYTLHKWMIQNTAATRLKYENNRIPITLPALIDLKETCQKVLLVPGLAETLMPDLNDKDYGQPYFDHLNGIVGVIMVLEKFPPTWSHSYVVESM